MSNKSQKNQHKHRDLCGKPEEKNHREGERDSTIIMAITMVILCCTRVSGLNWSSFFTLRGIYYLYK